MAMRGETWRFWTPVLLLLLMAAYAGQKLVRAHVDPKVTAPTYDFERELPARRGTIYSAYGERYPLAKSVPFWEYALDPLALTNAVVRRRGEPRRPKYAIVKTIADALGMDYRKLKGMVDAPPRSGWRNQPLGLSSDPEVHRILADSSLVAGVAIHDRQVRQYLHGRRLAHVLGSVNAGHVGSAGVEQRFNRELSGTPGMIRGRKDARGFELYDKRTISIDPVPGADVYLTIDHNIQFEAENALKWGVDEFGAGTGWCIVMDAKTAAVLAMASLPDFDPITYGHTTEDEQLNRAIAFNYEPGSVMKVITAATAIDALPGKYGPGTVFRTNRDDPNYFKLPNDAGHTWPATMTLRDAIVHSSNIVIGKLAYDLGPKTVFDGMKRFGFGEKTGIELPGEQYGIVPDPNKRMWDKASRSRAGIGQFVAVTAIQLAAAYQAIANDGIRMRPHVVEKVVAHDGSELYRWDRRARRHGSPRGDPRLLGGGQDRHRAEEHPGSQWLLPGAVPRDILRHRAGHRPAPGGAGDLGLRPQHQVPPGRQLVRRRLQAHRDCGAAIPFGHTRPARGAPGRRGRGRIRPHRRGAGRKIRPCRPVIFGIIHQPNATVAQLDRALASEAEGCWFDPSQSHQNPNK